MLSFALLRKYSHILLNITRFLFYSDGELVLTSASVCILFKCHKLLIKSVYLEFPSFIPGY